MLIILKQIIKKNMLIAVNVINGSLVSNRLNYNIKLFHSSNNKWFINNFDFKSIKLGLLKGLSISTLPPSINK